MNNDILIAVGLTCLGLGMSSLFSGIETGLYTLNRVRLAVRAGHQDRAALRLRDELNHPNRLLATILLGNNMANYLGSFGIALLLAANGVSPGLAIVINACVLVPLLFVFGETLPKDLFRTHTDHWSYVFGSFLMVIRWILTITLLLPIVQLFARLLMRVFKTGEQQPAMAARQRIVQLMKEGVGAGVLSETQTTLANRALALRHRAVQTAMVPWSRVIALNVDASPEHRARVLQQRNFTRFPVVRGTNNVIGIVQTMDVLVEPRRPTTELMHEPLVFSPHTPIRDALQQMRRERTAMAIVASERARPLGIVTMKDLVEPLTGTLPAW